MALSSILKPDQSVMLGLANGAVVMAIYNGAIPSLAQVRIADPHDSDVESARKQAAWASAAVLGFMFLITRDRNSFLIGGLVLAGTDIMVKHANGLNPHTQRLDAENGDDSMMADFYPLPEYSDDQSDAVDY